MSKVVNTLRAIIGLALLILVLIFCFQNMDNVDIKFLSFKIEGLPLFIALFGVLAFGSFIGFLFGLISGSKKKREENRVSRKEERASVRQDKPTNDSSIPSEANEADDDATKTLN